MYVYMYIYLTNKKNALLFLKSTSVVLESYVKQPKYLW